MVRHNNRLPDNLPQLQNLIKRDPESYKEEVSSQLYIFFLYHSTLSVCCVILIYLLTSKDIKM